MDYAYVFRVLLKRKWIIIGSGVIAALIAFFLTKKEQKEYRSFTQISTGFAIQDEISVLNNQNMNTDVEAKFNNAIVTATSPTVLSLLSYKLILHDLQNNNPFRTLTEKQKESPVYKEVNIGDARRTFENKLLTMKTLTSFDPGEKKLLAFLGLYGYSYPTLKKILNVSRLEQTDYLQFEAITENPDLSAFIVNTAFQEFLKYYQNVRSNRSQESIDTLQSLLEKKKQEVDARTAQLKAAGMVNGDIASTSNLELIVNLQQALSGEEAKQTKYNYELQKVNAKLASLNTGKKADNSGSNDNEELLALRDARDETLKAYVASGSTDEALRSKYENLKAQYQKKLASRSQLSAGDTRTPGLSRADLENQKNDIEFDIKASNDNIAKLEAQINAARSTLASDASKSTTAKTLLRDAELANKEYLDAKQRYNEAMDITSSSVTNLRQILMGQPAISPEPSKKMLAVVSAGTGAFFVTMLIVIFLTWLDSSIRTPGIFSRLINLKMISMVNFMDLRNRNLIDIIGSKDGANDILDKKRHNVFRESLRKLRYEIERSGKKIFLFTSTQKGQGKTTLIEALSFSMSLSKKRILIIDTNFCNNDLTVQLNAKPVLEKIDPVHNSGKSLIEKVKSVAQNAEAPGVFIIGSEGGDYTPSEILPRENLLHHLHELTAEYDYIFLEGPPLNDFSDAKELTQYVDGVIAIFSATQVIKQIDKESLKFYKELDGKFYGAVLNKVDLENLNVK